MSAERPQTIGKDPGTRTILVVDDHPVVALGIKLALRLRTDLDLVGIVADPPDLKSTSHAPDALVLDLAFAGVVNLAVIRQCRLLFPSALIVVFSSLPAHHYKQGSLNAGADAYLTKDHDLDDLFTLILSLLAAGPRPSGLAQPDRQDLASATAPLSLTPKEIEIARLLSRGLSIADIALKVGANANTVSVHRDNVRRKLGCRNSRELVARLARLSPSGDLDV